MDAKTVTFETAEIEINGVVFPDEPQQAKELRNLEDMDWYVKHFWLKRGDIATFRQVEVTSVIGQERCWKYGYNGSLRDIVVKTERRTLSEECLKLWHTPKKGWYWIG